MSESGGFYNRLRKDRVDRFLFHTLCISMVGVLAVLFPDPALQGHLLIGGLVLFLLYEMARNWDRFANVLKASVIFAWIPLVVSKASDRMVRPIEIGTRTSALDFVIGLAVAWMFCPVEALAVGCLVTAWADPLAREVGLRYGVTTWPWKTKKTYVGSFTCFVVGAVIASIALCGFYEVSILAITGGIIVGVAAMFAELIPQKEKLNLGRFGKTMSPADNFWLTLTTSCVAGVVITHMLV